MSDRPEVAQKFGLVLPFAGFEQSPDSEKIPQIPREDASAQSQDQGVDPKYVLPEIEPSRVSRTTAANAESLFERGALEAQRYSKPDLVLHYEHSDILGPAIAAMTNNITGLGYELIPLFPKEDEEGNPLKPPPEADQEKNELELFLSTCFVDENGGMGIALLTHRVDLDVEVTGDGYIEVLRNSMGKIAAFEHIQAATMLHGTPSDLIAVQIPVRHPTTGKLVAVQRYKRFRAFCQVTANGIRWFKAFGDPRHINWRTGAFRNDPWPAAEDGSDLNGTEVLHFANYFPEGSYGVPSWVGASPHIRAGRSAAELMPRWFAKAPIGLKVAMIAGGTWKQASLKQFMAKLEGTDSIRGERQSFSVLVLEAETDTSMDSLNGTKDAAPRMAMEDITWEVPEAIYHGKDSLIATSRQAVARMFRLSPIFYGDTESYNRETADTALSVTEDQVFRPIRQLRWETPLNTRLLPEMGVNYWTLRFKSLAAVNYRQAQVVGQVVQGGGASPNQLIRLWNELTGLETPLIKEKWGDKPLELVTQMLDKSMDPNGSITDAIQNATAQAEEQARTQLEMQLKAQATAARASAGQPGEQPTPSTPGKAPAAGRKPKPLPAAQEQPQAAKPKDAKPAAARAARKGELPETVLDGLTLVTEVPAGAVRFEGSAPLTANYGYIKGTLGTDGEPADVWWRPDAKPTGKAFVVIQVHPTTGTWDEYKVVMCEETAEAARALYLANMDSAARFGGVLPMTPADVLQWFGDGEVQGAATALTGALDGLMAFRKLVQAEAKRQEEEGVDPQWYA